MQRWLDAGSGGGGAGTAGGTSSGGGTTTTSSTHKEGTTSTTHVIPAHTTMPRHGKMDPAAAAAATPGCTLQWPLLANDWPKAF